jgi:hypothetical protein
MKDQFSCFYDNSNSDGIKNIWESPNTRFVFDTNVLLNLYSFNEQTRKDFFAVLKRIEDRIWIPYHVALEYQRNRISVIIKRRKFFEGINKSVDDLASVIDFKKNLFTSIKSEYSTAKNFPDLDSELNATISEIEIDLKEINNNLKSKINLIKKIINKHEKEKLHVNSHDKIRDELDKFFSGPKTGVNIFTKQDDLSLLYKEGETRYQNNIPPGYKDANKDEETFFFNGLEYKSKFGDLIVFKQLIDFSKDSNIENIIFISDDSKEDWLNIIQSEGKKTLGARYELKQEIYNEADIKNFNIFGIYKFLDNSKNFLKVDVKDESYIDVKQKLALNDQVTLKTDNFTLNKEISSLEKNVNLLNEYAITHSNKLETLSNPLEDESLLSTLKNYTIQVRNEKIEKQKYKINNKITIINDQILNFNSNESPKLLLLPYIVDIKEKDTIFILDNLIEVEGRLKNLEHNENPVLFHEEVSLINKKLRYLINLLL